MANKYNLKNPAVKRIMQEARELAIESCYEYEAHPLEDNLFEWHFTVRGPGDTEFEKGRYHGRILLPTEYPFKPPELIFLTPNGRFELNTKVCLSITGFHPEYWQPAWGIRTVILAVMGFFPTEARGAIGGLDYSKEERRIFAKKSNTWKCTVCDQRNDELLSDTAPRKKSSSSEQESMPAFALSYKKDNNRKDEKESNEIKSTETTTDDKQQNPKTTEPSSPQQQHFPSFPAESSSSSSSTQQEQLVEKKKSSMLSEKSKSSTAIATHTDKEEKGKINIKNNSNNSNSIVTTPSVNVQEQQRNSSNNYDNSRPPFWLDVLIGGLIVAVIGLLIRRYT